ncbi:MAG: hypothetical protein RI990_334, partial [Planctomycetota bacterium]
QIDDGARSLAVAAVAAAAVATAWRAVVLVGIYRTGGFPSWAGPLFGLGAAAVGRILWEGASDLERRLPVRWGGKEYVLEPTRD